MTNPMAVVGNGEAGGERPYEVVWEVEGESDLTKGK